MPSRDSTTTGRLRHAVMLVLILSLGLVAGCQQPEAGSFEVTVLEGADLATLDARHINLTVEWSALSNLYDPLLWKTEDMELVPGLATSWEWVDETSLKLELREGVKFHNGDPFTADDVKFTLETIIDPDRASKIKHFISPPVVAVEKVDDYTVILKTDKPDAPLPRRLTLIYVLPSTYYQEVGEEQFGESPVGTGPFKFVEWQKDQNLTLEAFDDYWRGAPQIDRIVFKPIPEASVRVAELRSGGADVVVKVPPDEMAALGETEGVRGMAVPSARHFFIQMNPANPPFDDRRVRQAMNYAVDKETIVETLLQGFATVANGPIHAGQFGYNPDQEPYPYNPNTARQLLAEAGYPDGFEIDFVYSQGRYSMDKEVAEAVMAQLEQIDVQVEPRPYDPSKFVDVVIYDKDVRNMFQASVGDAIGDADYTYTLWFDPTRPQNFYANPAVESAILEERAEYDVDKRLEMIHELDALLKEEAPWIYMFTYKDTYGVSDRIDWSPRTDELVWLYEAKPAD